MSRSLTAYQPSRFLGQLRWISVLLPSEKSTLGAESAASRYSLLQTPGNISVWKGEKRKSSHIFLPYVSSPMPHGSKQFSVQGTDGRTQLQARHSPGRSRAACWHYTERTTQHNSHAHRIHLGKPATESTWQLTSLGTQGPKAIEICKLILNIKKW